MNKSFIHKKIFVEANGDISKKIFLWIKYSKRKARVLELLNLYSTLVHFELMSTVDCELSTALQAYKRVTQQ